MRSIPIAVLSVIPFLSLLGAASDHDAPFVYHEPMTTLGQSPPNINNELKNKLIFDDLWSTFKGWTYLAAQAPLTDRKDFASILTPILSSMLDLRAFTSQNKVPLISDEQKMELSKINAVLESLHLYYDPNGIQKVRDASSKIDPNQAQQIITQLMADLPKNSAPPSHL